MKSFRSLCVMMGLLMALAAQGAAAAEPATQAATPKAGSLTVAILDFDSNVTSAPDLGKQINEALTALLGGEAGIQLVDRAALTKTLQEHELNLSGVIDPQQAIKVGRLVGAKLLVTGRAFVLDKQVMIVAKIIATETSLVEGVLVKGTRDAELGGLVVQLGEKVGERIRVSGPSMVAAEASAADPLAAYKKKLEKRKLPVVAISIEEQHIGQQRAIDPPADTELRRMLTQCGVTVVDTSETTLDKAQVELLIKGEAFSEFAARIGNLTSCSARVELKVVRRSDGKILLTDRATARAADLSEQMAGKTALEKAAHEMGLKVLAMLAE